MTTPSDTLTASKRSDLGRAGRRRPTRSAEFILRLTPAEKARIEWAAATVHLSLAAYVRSLGLGQRPRPLADRAQIQEVLRVNADVGRFGGLLKLWLTDDPKLDRFDRKEVRQALAEVEETRSVLRRVLRWTMRGRAAGGVPLGQPWQAEDPAPKRSKRLRVPVTDGEKASITAAAKAAAAASGSDVVPIAYLRALALEYQPRCLVDPSWVAELQEPWRELARLGALIKAWLADDPELDDFPPARRQAAQDALAASVPCLEQLRSRAGRKQSGG